MILTSQTDFSFFKLMVWFGLFVTLLHLGSLYIKVWSVFPKLISFAEINNLRNCTHITL